MTNITVGSLSFLLSLAEGEEPGTTADMLTERTGTEGKDLVASGMFVPGPNRTMVNVELSNGDGVARVEDDPDTGGFRYFHPEDGYIPLEPERMLTWRLNLTQLALLVARMLGMPGSFRPTELVEGLLWDLGTPRLGTRKGQPVLFGVRLGESDVRAAMKAELHLRRGAQSALMLAPARSVAADLTLPAVLRIVPLADVLDRRQSTSKTSPAVLDRGRLGALADPRPTHADAVSAPVQCSPDGAWLRIDGRELNVRGKKKMVLRLLFDAWENSTDWVDEEWLLGQAEYDSKRIEDVFKDKRPEKRNEWKQFIEVHDGKVRLKVPKAP